MCHGGASTRPAIPTMTEGRRNAVLPHSYTGSERVVGISSAQNNVHVHAHVRFISYNIKARLESCLMELGIISVRARPDGRCAKSDT